MKKSEKGFTLVELLAALSLLSIITIMGINIYISMQNQMGVQTNEVQTQANERLAMNIITKEIRKAQSVDIIGTSKLRLNDMDIYWLDNTSLMKNEEQIAANITDFYVMRQENEIRLKIGRLPETILYLRE